MSLSPTDVPHRTFPDFNLETFDERHHFDPPHRSEPDRVAEVLVTFWDRATNASR